MQRLNNILNINYSFFRGFGVLGTLNYSGKKRALQDLLALTTKRITILAEDSFL